MSNHNRKSNGSRNKLIAGISAVVIAALAIFLGFQFMSPTASSSNGVKSVLTTKKANTYKVSDEEKAYLKINLMVLRRQTLILSLMSMHQGLNWMSRLFKQRTIQPI